jgi:hypothetical protein
MAFHIRPSVSGSPVIASEIMKSAGQLYNIIVIVGFCISKHVAHYMATLDARDDMLHNDANSRD